MPIDTVGVGALRLADDCAQVVRHLDAEPFGPLGCRHVVGAIHPEREFIAAQPGHQVGRTHRVAQHVGGAQQHLVARRHGRGGHSPA